MILTERKTRMTIIILIKYKHPHILNATLYKAMKKYKLLIKSITSDNILEFKALDLFGYQTGIDIYKWNPHPSYERNLNENANGLIRREYPKSTDFNDVSNIDIYLLMDNINNMPRKIFNFNLSIKEYSKELSIIDINEVMQKSIEKGNWKKNEENFEKTRLFIHEKNKKN